MSELDFSQGFSKSGQLVQQYGGAENRYNTTNRVKFQQSENLFKYVSNKYSRISKVVREKWRDEMFNMEGFEYMNVNFLAAALDLYENYYTEDEEINVIFRNIFKRNEVMEKYYDLLIEKVKKKSGEEYEEKKLMTKQFLYTYIIKIYKFREQKEIIDTDNIVPAKTPLRSRDD
jgi:hypothetical protein